MDTILLDSVAWDLVLDANGNIARASQPYSLAQDAASVIKTYVGEVYFDTTVGFLNLAENLSRSPPLALLKASVERAAETVPDVSAALCVISRFEGRRIIGQVQVTSDTTGQTAVATFETVNPQEA